MKLNNDTNFSDKIVEINNQKRKKCSNKINDDK